ncbi:Hexokinase-5, partial [Monoraphidium neglectum]
MLPPRKDLQGLEDDIVKQMEEGMRKVNGSTVMMLPTYVLRLPTGQEHGSCYALDIGGTNFRVMHCQLSGEHGKVVGAGRWFEDGRRISSICNVAVCSSSSNNNSSSGSSSSRFHGRPEGTVMEQMAIPKEAYTGNATLLFDFLAK